MGHANTSSFVASFTSAEAKVLNQVHERNLGTRDMDWVVFEHCAKVFQEKNDIGIKNNAKARLRLLDTIEKQRKVLSANSEAVISVDCLAEDCDLEVHIIREDFEKMIAPTLLKLRQSLEKLKAETKVQISAVEIIGGGTRIPAVQKIIQEVFGMEVSRTLNATECCSRGAAIHAAMLSPLFKVAEYKVEEANYYPIRCSWLFQNPEDKNMGVEADGKNNLEKQTSILFDKGCAIPSVKAITFHRDDPLINFKLAYDPVPDGIQGLLANYVIHSLKPKEPEYGVKVRVVLNKNGLVELESAALNEDYYVEEASEKKDIQPEKKEGEQTPQEGAKPEESKEETKKKKKTRTTTLKADAANLNQLDSAALHQYIDDEHKMANADRIIHETYHTKNSLESYIYETRGRLNDQYANYVHQNVKDTFLAELQKAETWLYAEGANTTKEAYLKKIDDLKFFGNPIDRRFKEYNNLPEAIQNFGQTLTGFEQVVTSNVNHSKFC
jgi:heat shock protein 4